jgi:DNA-binding LacI/PurR family transcriptional regulator
VIKLLTHPEQVAETIRAEILAGKWKGTLPGIVALEKEFHVNRNTIQKALKILEGKKLLVSRGQGNSRQIVAPTDSAPRALKVGMLLYEEVDQSKGEWIVDSMHHLEEAGHSVFVAPETLSSLKMNVRRVARAVSKCKVDAWLVVAASDNVLRWFIGQPTPVLSICGSSSGLPIAAISLDSYGVFKQMMDNLISLGHRRIVCLSRENKPTEYERQLACPGPVARSLSAHGLSFSSYNWPCFENDPVELHRCIDRLFRKTPPSAFVVDESFLATVVYHNLIQRGLKVPGDVSLFCSEPASTLGWGQAVISHINWSSKAMVRPTLRWIKNVALGREDLSRSFIKVDYVEGDTIGPAPGVQNEAEDES